jgi:2-polyprenyl-3-methyl-5-hydroxy-6-metoxy-1,4-benzoquinol methylase
MVSVATSADRHRVTALRECLACSGTQLRTFADLGEQPLANDYHDGGSDLAHFPLAVNVCLDCFHSQLTHSVDAELLYKNYLYVSGTTRTLLTNFEEFVDQAERDQPGRKLRVLDIASNDGTLLSCFAARGHEVLGVDPAENLRPLSEANSVPTLVAYWGAETAASLTERFDVIVGMNVLAHLPYPLEFLVACREVLAENGRLYIQTSQSEMIKRKEFDTIYHEHHSFFSARSFATLAERAGLTVVQGTKVSVHGTSYRWTLSAVSGTEGPSVSAMKAQESDAGLYAWPIYEGFGLSVRDTVDFVHQTANQYRDKGYAVVGYGAAAKGNTLLNAANLPLEFIVDDNPLKIGMFAPGGNVPILSTDALRETESPVCVIVLAWNFFDEIVARIGELGRPQADVFVRYFPERDVCDG